MSYADIPEFTDMCTWFKEAADKGYFGKNFASDTWDYTSEVLGTGEAALNSSCVVGCSIPSSSKIFGKNFASDTWDYTSEVLGTGEAECSSAGIPGLIQIMTVNLMIM